MERRKIVSDFTIHQRHLPHWELPGATYHVVFSLKEKSLCALCTAEFAPIVLDTLAFYAGKRYHLFDHTVMPDHVHVILQPMENNSVVEPLGNIIGDIKRYIAHKINEKLKRRGSLWLDESYDRIIRNEREFRRIAKYIFENPVRAGLIEAGEDWKWWKSSGEPAQ